MTKNGVEVFIEDFLYLYFLLYLQRLVITRPANRNTQPLAASTSKMTLQKEDIANIKKEMIIGNLISIVIVFGVLIFDFAQVFQKSFSVENILLINAFGLLIAIFSNYLLNFKYRKDLEINEKYFVSGNVNDKISQTEYEAGSGSLYIPILGNLFPKIWGQQMKKEQIKFLKVDNELVAVKNSVYESVDINTTVKIYYSKISNTFLGIEKQ